SPSGASPLVLLGAAARLLKPVQRERNQPLRVIERRPGIEADGSIDIALSVRDPSGKDQGFAQDGIAFGVAGVERNGPLKTRNGLVELKLALEDVRIHPISLRCRMLQGLLQIGRELLGDLRV